jgi:glutamine synthetase
MARSRTPDSNALGRLAKAKGGKAKVAVTDIDGVLRGKYLHRDKLQTALESGLGFCNVVFGWDTGDLCYDNARYTGWHSGYPDAHVRLDLGTYREVPWDGGVPFLLGDFVDAEGGPLAVCPRQLLRRVIARLGSAGYRALASFEYEFFHFRETPQTLAEGGHQRPEPISPGMFGYSLLRMNQSREYANALMDEMLAFDVPIEGFHTETGPGVFEAAIVYSEALEAADRAVLFKAGAKEIAHRFGIMPSFVAGQLHCLPEILPLYAPTINSYKRLVEGAWAPTRANWGIDNRTTALRAIPGKRSSTRLETRVNGSDSNPYLALAAALASGLYGIENRLKVPDAVRGSGYEDIRAATLPKNLHDATVRFEKSTIARELFGEEFVEHFAGTRHWEWRQFGRAVTDWELARYFEII